MPIGLAILMSRCLHSHMQMSSVFIGVCFVIFVGILQRSDFAEEVVEVALTVSDESVQVFKSENGKQIGNPVLIERKDILDVVVNEVILSHKVVSVIVIRCLKSTRRNCNDAPRITPIQTLLMEGDVTLQLAFPGVEMSYMNCITMRREMCRALDLKIAL